MDNQKEQDIIKSRSAGGCIVAGYRLFNKRFKRIMRLSWPFAAVFALIYGVAAIWLLNATAMPLAAVMIIYVAGLLLAMIPSALALRRLRRHMPDLSLPKKLSALMSPRYWGSLLTVTLIVTLLSLVLTTVMSLPAIIVALANTQANLSMLMGDANGMPDYVVWLSVLVMVFTGFVLTFIVLAAKFPVLYAHGSVVAQEQERKDFNKTQS